MSPEDIAAAANVTITPTPVRIDPRSIRSFCAECGRPIDPRVAFLTDAVVGWKMPDGSQHLVGLCQRCIASLDAASHAETMRRLKTIRVKAFS